MIDKDLLNAKLNVVLHDLGKVHSFLSGQSLNIEHKGLDEEMIRIEKIVEKIGELISND